MSTDCRIFVLSNAALMKVSGCVAKFFNLKTILRNFFFSQFFIVKQSI